MYLRKRKDDSGNIRQRNGFKKEEERQRKQNTGRIDEGT